jgi:hypothetical protein
VRQVATGRGRRPQRYRWGSRDAATLRFARGATRHSPVADQTQGRCQRPGHARQYAAPLCGAQEPHTGGRGTAGRRCRSQCRRFRGQNPAPPRREKRGPRRGEGADRGRRRRQREGQQRQHPLHYAAAAGYDSVVKSLLRSNADPCSKNSKGETPLDVAAKGRKCGAILALIDATRRCN